ncbi:MAG: NAD(P)-binding protein, partial [Burkholderiales bacterium]
MPRKITVLGAGIVGICCAAYLQRDGHWVTLV